jgi:para-aminobenzoate synthetase/4-amino-4-deoxychorismate lyase
VNAPPRARFDDLVSGSAFELRQPSAQFVAFRHQDVPAVLDDADRAARSGCWVAGFVGYEASPAFDPALTVRPVGTARPLAWFTAFSERADVPVISDPAVRVERPWPIDWSPERHAGAVARIKEHLAAGESYQVNLTVRARSPVDDPLALYAGMSNAQGGAYNAYLDTGSHVIACASPELFFERTDNRVVTRPMKGTRRRGRWSADDAAQARDLIESDKDRAEHVMIVDLLRNDMARVARTGTVKVRDLAALERYPTVWQLTSTIEAGLATGVGTLDLFTALFPSGSVTGAPKASTMKIISDL